MVRRIIVLVVTVVATLVAIVIVIAGRFGFRTPGVIYPWSQLLAIAVIWWCSTVVLTLGGLAAHEWLMKKSKNIAWMLARTAIILLFGGFAETALLQVGPTLLSLWMNMPLAEAVTLILALVVLVLVDGIAPKEHVHKTFLRFFRKEFWNYGACTCT